jgi:hypothetical protein
LAAEAARHVRNAVHIGFGDHGFHGRVDAVIGKLPLGVCRRAHRDRKAF